MVDADALSDDKIEIAALRIVFEKLVNTLKRTLGSGTIGGFSKSQPPLQHITSPWEQLQELNINFRIGMKKYRYFEEKFSLMSDTDRWQCISVCLFDLGA